MDHREDREKRSPGDEAATRSGVKRPLVPLVLALMLGLAAADWAADWGWQVPRHWLAVVLAILLVVMALVYFSPFMRHSGTGKPDSHDELQKK